MRGVTWWRRSSSRGRNHCPPAATSPGHNSPVAGRDRRIGNADRRIECRQCPVEGAYRIVGAASQRQDAAKLLAESEARRIPTRWAPPCAMGRELGISQVERMLTRRSGDYNSLFTAELVRVLRSGFGVIWRAALCRGRIPVTDRRDGARRYINYVFGTLEGHALPWPCARC